MVEEKNSQADFNMYVLEKFDKKLNFLSIVSRGLYDISLKNWRVRETSGGDERWKDSNVRDFLTSNVCYGPRPVTRGPSLRFFSLA